MDTIVFELMQKASKVKPERVLGWIGRLCTIIANSYDYDNEISITSGDTLVLATIDGNEDGVDAVAFQIFRLQAHTAFLPLDHPFYQECIKFSQSKINIIKK